MKKVIILLMASLLSSCACMMSQVPPQYLYVDENCGAALPNYLPKLRITDNCGIDTVEQSPSPGSWLTLDNPTITVLIRAWDKSRNHTDMMFTVTLIDKEPPTIEVADSTLISSVYDQINSIYNIADRMLARQEMWFNSTLPDTIPIFDDYFNDVLLTWTSPAYAFTGQGGRWHTFIQPGDTLIMPSNY